MQIIHTIGNQSLWEREKTLFLSSKMAPINTWGKVFRWVDSLTSDDTVVCFNSSEFEAEMLKSLLVNKIPTVLVVMNRFRDTFNVQIEQALDENRLLIMELKRDEPRGKGSTPFLRNRFIISQVQHTVCGYIRSFGSIILVIGGQKNVTCLIDQEEIRSVAEEDTKPFRWTVAEDKRLLRMFYEDMGIHAIHKVLERPYSTIYTRIKSLTMNDEVLKGREFEDYTLELFDLPKNSKLSLKEWRGDKSKPGIYPESNSAPDFVFDYDGKCFAVECKWRSHLLTETIKELLPPGRLASFQQFEADRQMPVYLLLGTGGLPNDPDNIYLVKASASLTKTEILKGLVGQNENILTKIALYIF